MISLSLLVDLTSQSPPPQTSSVLRNGALSRQLTHQAGQVLAAKDLVQAMVLLERFVEVVYGIFNRAGDQFVPQLVGGSTRLIAPEGVDKSVVREKCRSASRLRK